MSELDKCTMFMGRIARGMIMGRIGQGGNYELSHISPRGFHVVFQRADIDDVIAVLQALKEEAR